MRLVLATIALIAGYLCLSVYVKTEVTNFNMALGKFEIGDSLPDFSVIVRDGSRFSLQEALDQNQLVLLHFWEEDYELESHSDELNQALASYAEKGLAVISLGENMSQFEFDAALYAVSIQFPLARDEGNAVAALLNIPQLPLYVLVGKDRSLLYSHNAYLRDRELLGEIEWQLRSK